MEQLILLQEVIPANHSQLQENKRLKKIQDTSGQSILDLSKNVGQLGLLEKMLMDTLNSVWTPYSRTWKVKITPQGHLVFQLQASVQTTKEKEYGLWPTPTTEVANRTTKYKQGGTSLSLAVKLKMWPTPTANEDACGKPTGKMQKMLGNHPEVRKPLNGGTLNPNWVEWLMGYPTGYTDLNH